jgi:hypothetical protein
MPMRVSRAIAATAITGAAMAAALGAFQLTSGQSHPAVGRPATSVDHVGSQVDFDTNGSSPEALRADIEQTQVHLNNARGVCQQRLQEATDSERPGILASCQHTIASDQQRIDEDELKLTQLENHQPQQSPQPEQSPQPQTSAG